MHHGLQGTASHCHQGEGSRDHSQPSALPTLVQTFLGVDVLEWSEPMLCLEAGLLGTCWASGRARPSTSARMHSWYSCDFRKRV